MLLLLLVVPVVPHIKSHQDTAAAAAPTDRALPHTRRGQPTTSLGGWRVEGGGLSPVIVLPAGGYGQWPRAVVVGTYGTFIRLNEKNDFVLFQTKVN